MLRHPDVRGSSPPRVGSYRGIAVRGWVRKAYLCRLPVGEGGGVLVGCLPSAAGVQRSLPGVPRTGVGGVWFRDPGATAWRWSLMPGSAVMHTT